VCVCVCVCARDCTIASKTWSTHLLPQVVQLLLVGGQFLSVLRAHSLQLHVACAEVCKSGVLARRRSYWGGY